jgi:hypothetical protein
MSGIENTSINPVISAPLHTQEVVDALIADDEIADAALHPKVYSGTGAATGIQMSKKGDIYVKTDTPHVYIAVSTTKSSGWVQVD